ncbi:chloride channel protein [Raineyella antarctica]|uniref:chloride channel protein n=1 Tax=Raineyella antarctica TaxID=1577474 RepID=UPI001587FCAA|nr:chloride channel protein [Raineyella antarctica]
MAVVLLGGLAAGVVGGGMVLLLHVVQALAYGAHGPHLIDEIIGASPLRRVLAPTIGGVLAGLGWWGLRRRGPMVTLEKAIGSAPDQTAPPGGGAPGPRSSLRVLPITLDAMLQILVVGSGASIGREGAPRQTAAVLADLVRRRLGVDEPFGRIVLAAAAGAGLAAVYNVPTAGALFALEVLLRTRAPRAVATAVAMSAIATVTAWPVVGREAVYAFAPAASPDLATLAWLLVAMPLAALLGHGFDTLRDGATRRRPSPGWRLPVMIGSAGTVVGALSILLPELPGNGKDIMQVAFAGQGGLLFLAVMVVLKPLATTLYIRAGAVGGLLTPALATGAALGAAASLLVQPSAGPADVALWALVGAAGVLAVTQRAPFFAAAMAWELTRPPLWTVPVLVAVAYGAVILDRTARQRVLSGGRRVLRR